MKYLLDASAMLALLLQEPGAGRVADVLGEAAVSAANLSEVAAKLSDLTMSPKAIADAVNQMNVPVFAVEESDAITAGFMRQATRHAGLSLGDRLCLATAARYGLIVLTADRPFLRVADAVQAEIELIR